MFNRVGNAPRVLHGNSSRAILRHCLDFLKPSDGLCRCQTRGPTLSARITRKIDPNLPNCLMTNPSEESAPPVCQYQFIQDLDARQNDVLQQLDELHERVEAALNETSRIMAEEEEEREAA